LLLGALSCNLRRFGAGTPSSCVLVTWLAKCALPPRVSAWRMGLGPRCQAGAPPGTGGRTGEAAAQGSEEEEELLRVGPDPRRSDWMTSSVAAKDTCASFLVVGVLCSREVSCAAANSAPPFCLAPTLVSKRAHSAVIFPKANLPLRLLGYVFTAVAFARGRGVVVWLGEGCSRLRLGLGSVIATKGLREGSRLCWCTGGVQGVLCLVGARCLLRVKWFSAMVGHLSGT